MEQQYRYEAPALAAGEVQLEVAADENVYKWLNRRGGKRCSFTWITFTKALTRLGVAKPRIREQRRREHAVFT